MKRWLICSSLMFTVLVLSSHVGPAWAETYPDRPIQLVIPGAPGDMLDIAGRLFIEKFEKIVKVSVIAVNKPGAAGTLGADFVIRGRKDGYTFLYGNTSAVVYNPAFSPESVPYNPLKDLDPLAMHVSFPDVISVQADAPWKNFNELVEYSKKNPGKVRLGTLGVGSVNHVRLEMIKSITGADISMVPFKGAMPALTALLGGHIDAAFVGLAMTDPHFKAGKLKGMLVDQKVAGQDIPTLQDLGYSRALPLTFLAFFAPVGIPEDAKKVLVPAIQKAINDPELVAKLQASWMMTRYKSPAELKHIMTEDFENARQIVKQLAPAK
jgi:tripartite-type tricarboxylate transporter receptor subunit TctC